MQISQSSFYYSLRNIVWIIVEGEEARDTRKEQPLKSTKLECAIGVEQ